MYLRRERARLIVSLNKKSNKSLRHGVCRSKSQKARGRQSTESEGGEDGYAGLATPVQSVQSDPLHDQWSCAAVTNVRTLVLVGTRETVILTFLAMLKRSCRTRQYCSSSSSGSDSDGIIKCSIVPSIVESARSYYGQEVGSRSKRWPMQP